ncbi:CBS domain-containing protein [Legionella micdadei]|uniref:CBS domain-containing protein n=1 Tax=Legionella micdadei TaxID=451 RepID=A0A098GG15_LEGMI|nr:CBS domain-containing protein [Legionella micdadei]ARG97515.1 CBS domain-containing protein [Legionella micdadei]ARH00175.1 CBS domain-containing protein [Legionella micdadei]KTD27581.1 CBS domain protein [Legionella micdadei]NSL17041.1 CBS domain-containing protein [Legionella micdadei]CEG60927.1 conserved protein of unknown function [CBS domain containing protein] [Legionella micdadei]
MQVRDVMTPHAEYLFSTATIEEAARKMQQLNTGFLPIGDKKTDKIIGALTDRDIVISAVASHKGFDTPVSNVMHKGIHYCYDTDDVNEAAKCMREKQIRRLVVLNKNKRLAGILSLGDISLRCDKDLSAGLLGEISKH